MCEENTHIPWISFDSLLSLLPFFLSGGPKYPQACRRLSIADEKSRKYWKHRRYEGLWPLDIRREGRQWRDEMKTKEREWIKQDRFERLVYPWQKYQKYNNPRPNEIGGEKRSSHDCLIHLSISQSMDRSIYQSIDLSVYLSSLSLSLYKAIYMWYSLYIVSECPVHSPLLLS